MNQKINKMKNKFSYAIIAIALTTVLSSKSFAQKTAAYIFKETPITQDEKSATFQVVLDNIDNDAEKNEYVTKLKGCKQVSAITPSDIVDKKVTYTITMQKDNIFNSFQNALFLSGIENTEFYGKAIMTSEFGQMAEAEYNKAAKSQRNPK
jgi:hypothetical protein